MDFVEQLFGLKGKTIVITGGGGVIAGAMAKALSNSGAKVSLWGRGRSKPMEEVVREMEERTGVSGAFHGVKVDTGKTEEVKEALEKTEKEFGTPEVLINGVGGNIGKSSFIEADMETFRKVLEMNLIAGFMIPTQVFASYWIERKIEGSVINMASMASYIPLSGVWAYDAAKSAVMNLTMGAAKEFASHGIRVNAIAPGFFLGYQNRALLEKNEETGELTERGKAVIDHTPFARFGREEDLWGVTVFLASNRASGFITGATIPVDGGYLVHNI